MTTEQRRALEEFVFFTQATKILDRKAETEMGLLVDRVDEISAVAADVNDAAETALSNLLKLFEAG